MTHSRNKLGIGPLLAAVVLAGCSAGDGVGWVRGEVTLDGQPLAQGVIRFLPADGKSPTASADIVKGHYEARVPIGAKRVEISAPKVVGKQKMYDTPDSPSVDKVRELIPAKFNVRSRLTMTVRDGKQQQSFELQSK